MMVGRVASPRSVCGMCGRLISPQSGRKQSWTEASEKTFSKTSSGSLVIHYSTVEWVQCNSLQGFCET